MGCAAVREQGQSHAQLLDEVNQWCLFAMTALNRDILDGRRPQSDFSQQLSREILTGLPLPEMFTPAQAQQLVVLLGLAGASAGRHYQEAHESHRATPEAAFSGLAVGSTGEPFVRYYARLAARTGTGHAGRDSYASLVRWNLPPVEVRWAGQQIATLPSAFDDGMIRTYTGVADETRFFGLLKASEALEHAVNQELMPLSEGSVRLTDDDAVRRVRRAVTLLDALRTLSQDFAARLPRDGLRVNYFMDVFRQYAVHWEPGDIPPSGALDPESLIRDLLVGIALPEYPERLRRVFPGLLDDERRTLTRLMNRDSLPTSALRLAGLDALSLAGRSEREICELVNRYPILAELYRLLTANARVAGAHLRLSKVFLFAPQRVRDRSGFGDPGVVSNRTGTTGMDETWLEMLTRVRHHHLLGPLHVAVGQTPDSPGATGRVDGESSRLEDPRVHFVNTGIAPEEFGIPRSADEIVERR